MNHQAAVIRIAQARGLDVSELTERQYNEIRLEIRTTEEIVADGAAMLMGRAKVSMGIDVVPARVKAGNLAICRANTCQSYGLIAGGTLEVCHRCNCTGKDLQNKAALKTEHCPAHLWDNRTTLTVDGKSA